MKFISNILIGFFLGIGAVLPGISSGVLCVIFGIYEKLINSFLSFFKNIKENFLFLFPILLGVLVGIVIFGKILKYLFLAYPIHIRFIFIGLILGSIPSLIKESLKRIAFKPYYLFFSILSMLLAFLLILLEKKVYNISLHYYNNMFLFLSGILMSSGVVIPGISSTLILTLLGIYEPYLNALSTLNLNFIVPLLSGVALGSILFMKIIKYLFENFYGVTFFSIIGFTIGSIFILYPGISFDINGIISLFSLFLGFNLSQIIYTKK